MSSSAIVFIGVVTVTLLGILLYETIHGITHAPVVRDTETGRGALKDIDPGSVRPLKILVATDGSPCSDRAVQSVAARPWPPGSEVQVVSVIHPKIPLVLEPTLTGAAGHMTALDEERRDAPVRVRRAEEFLRDHGQVPVIAKVLEGDPSGAILAEAELWKADLLVVGSHGHGRVTRVLLGSVSQHVALHANCSVEIVRCPHGRT